MTTGPTGAPTGLLTDRYELTMLASFVADGSVDHRACFEAFARRLPPGRRYGLLAGLGRLLPLIEDFTFGAEDIAWLLEEGVVDEATASYLWDFRFTGDVDAYREGDLYFPGSPVLTVSGTLGECVLLETLVLSVLNHDSAIASAAARMVTASGDRPLIEMGSRRTHEQAAVATARAAYVAGFASTSNLAAGRLHGVPTVGTAAHAFTLAHRSERAAFASQVAAHGPGTTLLVDTYDITQGIRNAVAVAGPGLGAIRIDSGDLSEEAHQARRLLDRLGAVGTRITVTSDLDEYVITALADAPIDGYGVGTRVATGSGHPTAGLVYKLVAVADEPGESAPLRAVAKSSHGKVSVGGRKTAYREYDEQGLLVREVIALEDAAVSFAGPAHLVQVPVMRGGRSVHECSLEHIREHAAHALACLPPGARSVADGEAAFRAELIAGPNVENPAHTTPSRGLVIPMNDTLPDAAPQARPRRALIVVDVQNDFVEGGSLAVEGGRNVASRISTHLANHADEYAAVIASRDWHDADSTNGGHIAEPGTQPDFRVTWPVHCVASAAGSDYAPELSHRQFTHHVKKGMGVPAYSAFQGVTEDARTVAALLVELEVTEVDVVGLATDHCVRATCLDAREHDLACRLLDGLHAGVSPDSSAAALAQMRSAGVETGPAERVA